MFESARERLSLWREQAITSLSARSPLDRSRLHAGTAASVLAEQAEAILPWLTSDTQRQQRGLGNPEQRTQRMDQAGSIKPHARYGTGGCRVLSNGGGLGVPGWSLAFAVPTVWRTRGHHHAILYDRHGRRSS